LAIGPLDPPEQTIMQRKPIITGGLGLVVVVLVAVVLAVSGGSTSKAQSSVAAGTSVGVKQTALGKTLVDARGRTLYLFQADKPNRSTLSPAGFSVWPAFTSNVRPQATGGADATRVGTIAGPGGSRQVTYNGRPLYYYVGDRNPGSVSGQRLNQFGAPWYVVSPSGNAVTRAASGPAAATVPAAAPAGSGYGY
jgi:predicted lipoprotein with Yx(FWY)xxD motif